MEISGNWCFGEFISIELYVINQLLHCAPDPNFCIVANRNMCYCSGNVASAHDYTVFKSEQRKTAECKLYNRYFHLKILSWYFDGKISIKMWQKAFNVRQLMRAIKLAVEIILQCRFISLCFSIWMIYVGKCFLLMSKFE